MCFFYPSLSYLILFPSHYHCLPSHKILILSFCITCAAHWSLCASGRSQRPEVNIWILDNFVCCGFVGIVVRHVSRAQNCHYITIVTSFLVMVFVVVRAICSWSWLWCLSWSAAIVLIMALVSRVSPAFCRCCSWIQKSHRWNNNNHFMSCWSSSGRYLGGGRTINLKKCSNLHKFA